MQILFQADLRGAELLAEFGTEFGKTIAELCASESQGEADVGKFASRLVAGTIEHRKTIDTRLQGVTRNWDLRRMATVDRNVLRMAIYELTHCGDVPPKVSINEAIDLAKKYSTANSGGFCNGILDRVRLDLEHEQATASAEDAPVESAVETAREANSTAAESAGMDSDATDA